MRKSVTKKMWSGFGVILLLLIVVGGLSLWMTIHLNNKYEHLLNDEMVKINIIDDFILSQKEIQSNIRGYMLYKDDSFLDKRTENLEWSEELLGELESVADGDVMRTHFEALQESMKAFTELQNTIVTNTISGKDDIAISIGKSSSNVENIVLDRAEMMKEVQYKIVEQTRKDIQKLMTNVVLFDGLLILVAVISGLIISTVISRSISRPVKIVTGGLNAIAEGDFTIDPLSVKSKDEIGEMAAAFNKMGADVANMIRRINGSTLQLAAQAEELSASSEESLASSEMVAKTAELQLSTSEHQRQISEQSATSMNDLTIGVTEIALNNEQMLTSADTVNQLVVKGSEKIAQVSEQMTTIHTTINESSTIMEEMEKHSEEIQKITGLITDIAEQTNLLSLNAAIEAARAGEYGKGFAVVAEEVRHLAEQSKTSAADIGKMVNQIQDASKRAVQSISSNRVIVDSGIEATDQSKQVFSEIQEAVGDVVEKIETVSAAIEEIQAMSDEVTKGANEVRELSTKGAMAASDTSAATEEQLATNHEISESAQILAKLSEDLQKELSHFRV
ncbi:methyl-accepting chemotaxis protein [Sporosarcina sp. USHLN248]|uniref:methyl-accepting chemotaxis protein n=1 Tax=Sporosarcina sp. USHLN248 TaxID=3081300 RepID=UPI0030164A45